MFEVIEVGASVSGSIPRSTTARGGFNEDLQQVSYYNSGIHEIGVKSSTTRPAVIYPGRSDRAWAEVVDSCVSFAGVRHFALSH